MPTDEELAEVIRDLLARRTPGSTICPSDAARAVGGGHWRDLMDPVRRVAGRMVRDGEVVVTQRGEPVDPAAARGPIRIGPC